MCITNEAETFFKGLKRSLEKLIFARPSLDVPRGKLEYYVGYVGTLQ